MVDFPIKNGDFPIKHGEILDLPIENGGSFHSYMSLPEGKL